LAILNYLLMTSAVEPSSETPFQALLDPNIRFRQTVQAAKKWIKVANQNEFHIILADNTGWANRLQKELQTSSKMPSLITVLDIPKPTIEVVRRGKGAAEAETILQAINSFKVKPNENIAKVNARYFVNNGIFLIDTVTEPFVFAAWTRPKIDSIDSTFFLSKSHFLINLTEKLINEIDDQNGDYFESVAAKYTMHDRSCDFERLAYLPSICGQSGTTGYNHSRWSEARMVSNLVRVRRRVRQSITFIKPKYQREQDRNSTF